MAEGREGTKKKLVNLVEKGKEKEDEESRAAGSGEGK